MLDWVGKSKAVKAAKDEPLRLIEFDSSLSFGTPTENMIVQGDNLAALKSLLPLYRSKVKCIYIDPPYNTGTAFEHYDDNFEHSTWLSMMYPRLELLRQFLSDDGAIFISIDDNEQAYLKVICDEIFGRSNFINMFIWQRNSSAKTEKNKYTVNTEFILMYGKPQFVLNDVFKPLSDSTRAMYNKDDNDGRGKYRLYPLQKPASPGPETTYDYIDNTGKIWKCPPKGWRMKFEKLKALENDGRLCLENKSLSEKAYWNERANEGKRIDTLWNDLPENTAASKEIQNIFGAANVFDTPKPTRLLERILQIATDKNSLILDAFAGSGTTAHAVINLNKQDDGNRKFILIESQDYCSTVTAERVKRVGGKFNFYKVGDKIFEETGELNQKITFEQLAAFIWFNETTTPFEGKKISPLLGVHNGKAIYLLHKDILTRDILDNLENFDGEKIIYADVCTVDEDELKALNVTFKQLPKAV